MQIANFIPNNPDLLFVELIFQPNNKFDDKLVPTNMGYVRFLSSNLDQTLKDKCVIFCDGFIRNYAKEQMKIGEGYYIRMNILDVISILD